MSRISKNSFGAFREKEVFLYKIINSKNNFIEVIDYGAILKSVNIKDKHGDIINVVLSYDNLQDYVNDASFIGASIGRYANRIKDGKLTCFEKTFQLSQNEGSKHIHGGFKSFSNQIWKSSIITDGNNNGLRFKLYSVDGEEGYPGNQKTTIDYIFTDDDQIIIKYNGISDKDTVFNPTNHTYFNLLGDQSKSILSTKLKIKSDLFTVITDEALPTGELRSVENTPFDFREFKEIGNEIDSEYEQIKAGSGYDHNFILNNSGRLAEVAFAELVESGIKLTVATDMPGVQFYSGNYLAVPNNKLSKAFKRRTGFCLETQFYPDSPNNSDFPRGFILRAGQEFKSCTIFKFSL